MVAAFSAASLDLANDWMLDSACSQHTTFQKDLLTNLRPVHRPSTMGFTGPARPTHQGDLKLRCMVNNRPQVVKISGVLYTPGSTANLLSVDQFMNKGAVFQWTSSGMSFGYGTPDTTLTTGRCGGCFPLHLADRPSAALSKSPSHAVVSLAAISERVERIWHARLGHIGTQNLRKLANQGTGINLKKVPDNHFCEPCALGKQHRHPHTSPIKPGKLPMELVHSDIMGPIQSSSWQLPIAYDGSCYIQTYLDDATQVCEVFCCRNKGAQTSFSNFKSFRNKHETGYNKIQRFRSDGGGEYNNSFFANDFVESGVHWEPIVVDNPEQNGTSERFGQTLMRKAHPMLIASGMDLKYWPFFVYAAAFLHFRSPNSRFKGLTPFEHMHKVAPDLTKLRVLGSPAYPLHMHRLRKFDTRAERCILVGYASDGIYELMRPNGKVIRRSSVRFDELNNPDARNMEDGDIEEDELSSEPTPKRREGPPCLNSGGCLLGHGIKQWWSHQLQGRRHPRPLYTLRQPQGRRHPRPLHTLRRH